MVKLKKIISGACATATLLSCLALPACAQTTQKTIVLRVANWEEYADLGEWADDEAIAITNVYTEENSIRGVNAVYDDFVTWFNENPAYDFDVSIEYSTFGTNEDLYNRLNLGDVYDLVCPSDYLIQKLIAEESLVPFSAEFMDATNAENHYVRNVSNYIDMENDSIFNKNGWSGLAACYMWGTTGLIYNPALVQESDVKSWDILLNTDYNRQVTIKDNVRDSYFAALAIANKQTLLGEISAEQRNAQLNATDEATVAKAEDILKQIKNNVYSFETDSGKSDMVTGKVAANFQWSGDGITIMTEAEDEGTELWYSVPDECTNLWFDGWVMLKDGIGNNKKRQDAAEAFINFMSRPDNAIRNMYYIGYTSAIAGDMVLEYMDWNYGADLTEDGLTELYEYDLSYFFGDNTTLYTPLEGLKINQATSTVKTIDGKNFTVYSGGAIDLGRQLFAQYPTDNVMKRSVVMLDFGNRLSAINQMWINVRCLDLLDINPILVGVLAGVAVLLAAGIVIYVNRYRIFKPTHKRGYTRIQ